MEIEFQLASKLIYTWKYAQKVLRRRLNHFRFDPEKAKSNKFKNMFHLINIKNKGYF
jgi:hypothetical protein